MDLSRFLDEMNLPLLAWHGELVIPAESATHAILIRATLEDVFPQYQFTIEHRILGSVVIVNLEPIPLTPTQPRSTVVREKIPTLIDALDIRLAAMIAESRLGESL